MNEEIKVFITNRETTCSECGEDLGFHPWITLYRDKGALCLTCADLDHLLFLRSGDAALTRRAKAKSKLYAVVLKWSRARKRYERQGLLVEEEAIEQAETECLADAALREARRLREAERREKLDKVYIKEYTANLRRLFPGMPSGVEVKIAEHACLKYSGRVGRSEMAKQFDTDALTLSVIAHIRHVKTNYDSLLMHGYDRWNARDEVRDKIDDILEKWRGQR